MASISAGGQYKTLMWRTLALCSESATLRAESAGLRMLCRAHIEAVKEQSRQRRRTEMLHQVVRKQMAMLSAETAVLRSRLHQYADGLPTMDPPDMNQVRLLATEMEALFERAHRLFGVYCHLMNDGGVRPSTADEQAVKSLNLALTQGEELCTLVDKIRQQTDPDYQELSRMRERTRADRQAG